MLLVFEMDFSAPVISRIESIGGGWVGGSRVGGGGGWVGSYRQVKAPIWTQRAMLCLQYVMQSTREAQTDEKSSLVPHAVPTRTIKCALVV